MADKSNKIFVIGHKNPDTDSICSAIGYAYLKRAITGEYYEPRRAGQLNEETRFVLTKFKQPVPEYLSDVRTQVRDIEVRKTKGVDRDLSIKKAWELMSDLNVVTLPIVEERKLSGLISVGDIAKSYMDVHDNKILSISKTSYKNIIETLEGSIIVSTGKTYFEEGKVLIAVANPDFMENYINKGDMVILGNRYESQLCAIEMKASCIIVCEGSVISLTIKNLAKERGCTIISTPHDAFAVARLINQSIPISYFMKEEGLITFKTEAFVDDIRDVMAKKRHRDFPILDHRNRYTGMLSRRNLLGMQGKKVILVDHNERDQAVDGLEEATILEIIDHHKIGGIETIQPIYFRNQPLGCTATIVYQMYRENNIEIPKDIAGLLCSAILSDTLMYRSPTCTQVDKNAAEDLAVIANINVVTFAEEMFAAGSNLKRKSPEEVLYQDFKKFSVGDTLFGVGQINSMNKSELEEIKEKLLLYLKKALKELNLQMLFFMLTDILNETTEVVYLGDGAKDILKNAFNMGEAESYILPGVVSRKKQFIPALMLAFNSEEGA